MNKKPDTLLVCSASFRCAAFLLLALLLSGAAVSLRAQSLVHRYSFDSGVTDSIGGANGSLVGDVTIAGGAAVLSGNKPSYIDLPNDLTSTLTSFTIETWLTWDGGAAWQRIWDFGNSAQGEDVQGQADASMWLTVSDINNNLGTYFKSSGQAFVGVASAPRLSPGYLHQVVATYDQATATARLYVDGVQVGIKTNFTSSFTDIGSTVNNWIGHSQYAADPDFKGSLTEFRIYDGALDASGVATNFANGPEMSGRGNLLSIRLEARSMFVGQSQKLGVAANFENAANLEITGNPEITYEVSDATVFTVSANGILTSVGSVNASATVSAIYQGKTNSQVVQVSAPVLQHRYSFAADASDSVGTAHGTLVGDATISGGRVVLSGNKPSYVDLPNDLVSNLESATIEAWVMWNGGGIWQRVWDFGNSVQGEDVQGQADNSIWLTPGDVNGVLGTYYKPRGSVRTTIATADRLKTNVLHQLVWVYDKPTTTVTLFLDGAQVAENTAFITSFADLGSTVNNWIGHSQYAGDPDFNGSVDDFRIYNGAFTPAAVFASFQNGPTMTGLGNLVAVRLLVGDTNMTSGQIQQLHAVADFQNAPNLDISNDPQLSFSVSDTNVVTVSSNGLLTALAKDNASALVSAVYQGQTNSVLVHVIAPVAPAPVLLHRYSFTTDAGDSVGGANGTLVGSAIISNNAVVMDGVKPSYVDLPNGMFATLTNYTIETWVKWNGGANWQRICDFGNNTMGEDAQGAGTNTFFITPKAAAGAGAAYTGTAAWFYTAQGQRTNIVRNPTSISTGAPHHLVVTYFKETTTALMYLDGVPVSTNKNMLTTLADFGVTVNNWLGHSQFSADPDFNGAIDEFRVYNGVLSAQGVAANFAAGPDAFGIPQPTMTISKSGNNLMISWTGDSDFKLESSATLGAGASWTDTGLTPVQSNGQNVITITPGGDTSFYRLRK